MCKVYINHNSFGLSLKHLELPIFALTDLDFYRYVTFTNDMYGKTVSELHQGNLRKVSNGNRYANLFEGDKVSYWAATPLIARREWEKHNPNETNHLMFWAYDDISSTFPTSRITEPLIIIDGIKLGFEKILEKCDKGVPLTEQDKYLISEIKKANPDCLAYKPHTGTKNPLEELLPSREANFMFFEQGFKKLSLREVNLRLYHSKNKNNVHCASGCDYTPDEESYGKCFLPIAKVMMDKKYLKSEEYLSRKTNCEEIARARFSRNQ